MRITTAVMPRISKAEANRPPELWYVPNPQLRTATAAGRAREIAARVRLGRWAGSPPGERDLFEALRTCAYRAAAALRTHGRESMKRRWVSRWRVIREHIVKQNLGLVYTILPKFSHARIDDDDLLSEGMYALGRAVDRFDPWRGYQFSTYACNSIIRAMMRRVRRENRYREACPVRYEAGLERPQRSREFENALFIERLHLILRENSAGLTGLEWRVLNRRFLHASRPQVTFEAIGREVGLSKERVRQIQNTALRKLRASLAADPLLQ